MFKNIRIKNEPFLIAEIGINHNGSVRKAKELIRHAKKNGFDAVKFQTYKSELVSSKNLAAASYQKRAGFKKMYSLLRKYQLSFEEFKELDRYCKIQKITFLSTPFDVESAKFLESLNMKIFKISSGDLDNFHLLNVIKKFKKPIILSTGLAENIYQIKKTLKFLNYKKKQLAILHCVSQYPVQYKYSNLIKLNELKKLKITLGYSDHTIGNLSSVVAVALGAKIFEKHITLDKKMNGPDHKASLSIAELKLFVDNIRDTYEMINLKEKKIIPNIKNLVTRRLFFSKDLIANTKITEKNIMALRSNFGVFSRDYQKVIGKKLKKNVKQYDAVTQKKITK